MQHTCNGCLCWELELTLLRAAIRHIEPALVTPVLSVAVQLAAAAGIIFGYDNGVTGGECTGLLPVLCCAVGSSSTLCRRELMT